MHETVIAQAIMRDANAEAKGKKIRELFLEVGELAHLTPLEAQKTLETLSGWRVEVKNKKAVVHCACGFKGAPEILGRGHDFSIFECPKCGKVPKVVDGEDIKIVKVIVLL